MLTSLSSSTTAVQRCSSEMKSSEPMQTKTCPAPGSTDGVEDSSSPRTHHTRHRLRPWLENLVNEGSVKGLDWIDKEKKLFKIPWKHAGKQDYNQEEDSKIFKLWSLNTGKYKPGIHVPEPAVWKTRLRTALNKLPDIDEVHEKTQLDIPEPYRVYRLLPKKPSNSSMRNRASNSPSGGQADHSRSLSSVGGYSVAYNNPYMVDQRSPYINQYPALNGSDRHALGQTNYQQQASSWFDPSRTTSVDPSYGYTSYNCYNTSSSSSASDLDIISDVITEDIGGNHGHHPASHAHYPTSSGHMYEHEGALNVEQGRHSKLASGSVADTLTNNNDPRHVNYHDLVPMTTVTSSGFTTCTATTKTNPPPSYGSSVAGNQAFPGTTTCAMTMSTESGTMDTSEVANHQPQQQQHGYSSNSKRMRSCKEPSLPDEHVMAIQISYQSTDAGYRCVDNPNGCLLYFNQPWEEGIQRGMEAFNLPDIRTVTPQSQMAERQIRQTAEVLGCFEKGMSIECRHGNIYVTRRCRSVVFWCAPNTNETPTKLERDVEVKVFELGRFRDQIRRYYLGEDGLPAPPEIYFTVAQKLVSHDMPLHSCLISIVVSPLRACEELRALSPEVHTLHQSIRSGLLEISGPSSDCSSPLSNTWSDLSQFRRMSAMV